MKKVFFIALAALFLFSPASQAQVSCGQFDKAWSACKADEDCVVAQDACGWPAAYNTAFAEDAGKYNRCVAPMIECDAPKDKDAEKTAACEEGICVLKGK